MTRVSSFGHQQVMLSSLLRNQEKVFDNQMTVTTGKKELHYSGLASEVDTLLGAKNTLLRTQSYLNSTDYVERQLSTNDIQLDALFTNAENVRDTVLNAIAMEETFSLEEALNDAFTSMISALNTRIGGVYIFSGARTDVPPVNASDLTDLVAAAAATDLFENDNRIPTAKIGQNTEMEYGILADDVAGDIFTAMKNLADFDAGAFGPIDGQLTPVQRTFLEGELSTLESAIDTIQLVIARNGNRQQSLENTMNQHLEGEAFLKVFISDIEDADIAEAITNLENNQVALQASYQITSQLSQLSLLNYI
ncbi:flagellin [Emcibacter sp.]|uniref:flagellin n=1 Tax=Emcibacter sp. TaxID=1979954 RepID=UPI003A9470CB